MGYSVGFEGPHPSELPRASEILQTDLCGHVGYRDRWHGDVTTEPGYVFSCGLRCGLRGSQVFFPDEEQTVGG